MCWSVVSFLFIAIDLNILNDQKKSWEQFKVIIIQEINLCNWVGDD